MDFYNKENYLLEMIINKSSKKINLKKDKIETIFIGNMDKI
jgi:hypothetical protein